ncbi:MAG: hypothetical protein MAG451_00125 [Anaerolineales bacterium]|nr:hypothetical protein [Anaerolineales bacterium]
MQSDDAMKQLTREEFPFPISHAYTYLESRVDPDDRYAALMACFEVTLKTIASIALANFMRDIQEDPKLGNAHLFQDLLDVLSRPLSLGHWHSLLRLTLRPNAAHREQLVVPELFDFYYRVTEHGNVKSQKQNVQTIQRFIQERNEEAHHRNRSQTSTFQRQVDLYEFPYDWRRPIDQNGDLLHECVERWAGGDSDRQFTLVGHSMGGVVARAYLARHTAAADKRIKRLIMHGTPHFGVAGGIVDIALGNRNMDIIAKLHQENAPRRLMYNMPSIYQLLPAPPALFPSSWPYPANWDLYDATAWRLEGVRQDYLDAGRQFHELLASADPQVEVIEIAGCHIDTVVEVQRSFGPDERPRYDIVREDEGPGAGDGTIPLWSAELPGATVYYIQQVHRYLPKNKDVIDATLDLIHGGTPDLPTGLPPREAGLLGWLFDRDLEAPPEVEAEKLRQQIETGTAGEAELSQLYFGPM